MKEKIIVFVAIGVIVLVAVGYKYRNKILKPLASGAGGEKKNSGETSDFPLTYGNKTPNRLVREIQQKINYLRSKYAAHPGSSSPMDQIEEDGLFGSETSDALAAHGWEPLKHEIDRAGYEMIMNA